MRNHLLLESGSEDEEGRVTATHNPNDGRKGSACSLLITRLGEKQVAQSMRRPKKTLATATKVRGWSKV